MNASAAPETSPAEQATPPRQAVRNRGLSVALIGADGAGKTTVARAVAQQLPYSTSYVYMGSNLEAGNWMLPTTWCIRQWKRWRGTSGAGAGPPARQRPRLQRGRLRGWIGGIKSTGSMLHRVAEQSYRHLIADGLKRAGRIVLFDRHFYTDYYAFVVDPSVERTRSQRLHGFILGKVFPKPDVVIFLDAPSELLLARKGEGTRELLDLRRQDCLRVCEEFDNFLQVDASRPLEQVVNEVAQHIVRSFTH